MNLKKTSFAITFALLTTIVFGQNSNQLSKTSRKDSIRDFKFSINTTWLSFANFEEEKKIFNITSCTLNTSLLQKTELV